MIDSRVDDELANGQAGEKGSDFDGEKNLFGGTSEAAKGSLSKRVVEILLNQPLNPIQPIKFTIV